MSIADLTDAIDDLEYSSVARITCGQTKPNAGKPATPMNTRQDMQLDKPASFDRDSVCNCRQKQSDAQPVIVSLACPPICSLATGRNSNCTSVESTPARPSTRHHQFTISIHISEIIIMTYYTPVNTSSTVSSVLPQLFLIAARTSRWRDATKLAGPLAER